ncbi:MAG: glycosyl hydrolase [Pirellulales bacterium]
MNIVRHRRVLVTTLIVCVIASANTRLGAAILSSKRGFADTGASYNGLQAAGAGWYYNWGTAPSNIGAFDANFSPMIWGAGQMGSVNYVLGQNPQYVLGFNEPERSDQANMAVSTAITNWTTISNATQSYNAAHGTNIKLISPAVADTGGATGGQQWLSNFMSQASANNLKVDAVAFHWYAVSTPNDPASAASQFLSRVDSYHNSYGLPVFITEFAIHDWGGSYTDAQIIEANRQFLNIVIPGLESRSYVAGYSWYNWFSDSALFSGNPSTPTPMSYGYNGAVGTSQVVDISGQNLGEHAAYLTGGELTMTGAAGTVRYINALTGTSTISGTTNWALSSFSNWVRIQPGAILRKSGSNQVTFSGAITNNGTLAVSEGKLLVRQVVSGAGGAVINDGGTLDLGGSFGRMQQAPLIDVQRGGTFDVSAMASTFRLSSGQTLQTDANSTIRGNAVAGGGSTVSGRANVTGNLTLESGATLRIGGSGLASPTGRTLIDNFESYSAGKLNAGATGGVWQGVFNGTANAQVTSSNNNNSLEYYGASAWRGAQTNLQSGFGPNDFSLANGSTATYFFRVQRQGTQSIDGIFGLTDQANIGINAPWQELAVTLSLFQDTSGANTALRAFDNDGGGDVVILNNVNPQQWYNIWLIVNNSAKTFQVATSTGADDGTLFPNTFQFGRRTAAGAALTTFAAAEFRSVSNPANASVRIDDLYKLTGQDLTNPLSTGPQIMSVQGDFQAQAGATLQFDILSPTLLDRLSITGNLQAAGTLSVALAFGAPAPQFGDSFDILDFAAASGAFSALNLPALTSDLAWDTSQLYIDGSLAIGLAGDFNTDGEVNAADYVTWQKHIGQPAWTLPNDNTGVAIGDSQYELWRANFGHHASSASASLAAVPEPSGSICAFVFLTIAATFALRIPAPALGLHKS